MIAMGELAASVVHEINNPVAGMLNFARLMLKILDRGALTLENTEKFRGYLSLVESELSRCSKIISNLLAFSRKSALEFGEVNLNDLLNRCILLSEHRLAMQNIRINSRLDPGVPVITGDFNQLQQCVINLIFNAIDAMPHGGQITIESVFDHHRRLAEIRVADSGMGIAEEDLHHIFDPFFTTKTEGKGIGLGLSTVYGIIDRHRGRIEVKSRPGEGAVFTMSLPVNV
jgi:signal transduction histidine kinase